MVSRSSIERLLVFLYRNGVKMSTIEEEEEKNASFIINIAAIKFDICGKNHLSF